MRVPNARMAESPDEALQLARDIVSLCRRFWGYGLGFVDKALGVFVFEVGVGVWGLLTKPHSEP